MRNAPAEGPMQRSFTARESITRGRNFPRAISSPLIAYFASVFDFRAQQSTTITNTSTLIETPLLFRKNDSCSYRFALPLQLHSSRTRRVIILENFHVEKFMSLVSPYDVLNSESKFSPFIATFIKRIRIINKCQCSRHNSHFEQE